MDIPNDLRDQAKDMARQALITAQEKHVKILSTLIETVKARVTARLANDPNLSHVDLDNDWAYLDGGFYHPFDYIDEIMANLRRQGFTTEVVTTGRWLWKKKFLRIGGWDERETMGRPYR